MICSLTWAVRALSQNPVLTFSIAKQVFVRPVWLFRWHTHQLKKVTETGSFQTFDGVNYFFFFEKGWRQTVGSKHNSRFPTTYELLHATVDYSKELPSILGIRLLSSSVLETNDYMQEIYNWHFCQDVQVHCLVCQLC